MFAQGSGVGWRYRIEYITLNQGTWMRSPQEKKRLGMEQSIFHIFFIHSAVDRHLGCFHILAIVNSAAMNTGFFFLSSRSVMSDSLWPHGLQHARLPCLSPTPGAYSNLCLSSWWCHPTISSSIIPFSSCLHSFPALGSFPMSQFFSSGSQSIGVSASALSFQQIFKTDFL